VPAEKNRPPLSRTPASPSLTAGPRYANSARLVFPPPFCY
jgi:hypothetical protein